MRITPMLLVSLFATTAPALAAESAASVKGAMTVSPFSPSLIGAGLEGTYAPLRLTLAAEGVVSLNGNFEGAMKIWSTWVRWRPMDGEGSSWGFLAGYNGSYGLFPGPAMVPPPGAPDPRWEEPGVLTGMFIEWGNPSLWLRLSPHVAWGFRQYVSIIPTFRSAIAGPPLVEVGWRPLNFLELGLRLSAMPVRLGVTF